MTDGRALRVLLVTTARPSDTAARLRSELLARGHDVVLAEGAAHLAMQPRQRPVDVALLDDPEAEAGQVRAALLPAHPEILAVAALETPEAAVVVEQAGEIARGARASARLARLLAYCEPREPFLTEDPALREVVASLERLGGTAAPVLIVGERGTGRELLARALHAHGPRADAPFVVLEPGRAPGAAESGVLDLADGGTLFVRDVEQLSDGLQAELVGLLEQDPPPLRLVASTAADPDLEAHAGQLRRDLLARLTARVRIPPLRERPGDVGLLAAAFARQVAGRRLDPATVLLLQKQPWPGNVRELRLVVERAALTASRDPLEPGDLQLPGEATWATAAVALGLTLAELERDYIQAVLASHDGHRGRTARTLGIDPKTLYNKLGTERPRRRS